MLDLILPSMFRPSLNLNKFGSSSNQLDLKLGLNQIKLGNFLVAMKGILRPYFSDSSVVEYYLTQAQILKTQNEVTSVLNSVLQNIINDTEITWALDDAVDIFMTTGSGIISGNFYKNLNLT